MLARLESAYLALLRVVILVAATLALIVAVLGIVVSAPYFAGQLGMADEAQGGNLADFVTEQRASNATSASDGAEGSDTQSYIVSALLQDSARRIVAYVKKHHKIELSQEEAEKHLASKQSEMPLEYQRDYEVSLDKLTKQLQVSAGKPLSTVKLDELLQWHDQRFKQVLAEKEAAKGEQLMTAVTAFGTAGGAFMVFVFLVFCFLFVRIERNLRVVRVANAEADTQLAGE